MTAGASAIDPPLVELELDGPIGWLSLNRPESRNAMSAAMGQEVQAAVEELNRREGLRAVLVRGRGKGFCAGGDLGFIEARLRATPEQNREAMLGFYRLFLSIASVEVPTIAAIHGAAMGAGLCFAMACDMRLCAAGTRLALNFVRLGIHPGMGATYFLPRLVGPARAAELLFTGRSFGATEALEMGLVNAVHGEDELFGAARSLAEEIAGAAPAAVRGAKYSLRAASDPALERALLGEAAAQAADYATDDVREALNALRERRSPRFSGR